ncbi:hypothetical protein [Demequina pelophila]|uniref:hypothetical protein n=1 Tax=Demequina pelophila TaxID=1638984 RepID=UPI0007847540|nr:hypothetical protein [Demequina pelophila]
MRALTPPRMAALLGGIVVVALAAARAIPFDAVLVLVGLIVGALAVWEAVVAYRHRHEAERFAREHGWEHIHRTAAYSVRFTGHPFDLPGRHRQEDVLRGTYAGQPCATYTHVAEQAIDARRGGSHAQAFQVTLAELPVDLPRLDLVPEHLGHHVAQALGGMDIEVESHEFNSRWRVTAADRRYGHDVVDPRMIARLLEPDAAGVAIRIEGGAVMIWRPGRGGTADLARRLGLVAGIARRIPRHVLRRYSDEGRARPDPDAPLVGPAWAVTPGVLTGGRYTGIGVDADGDGVEDWRQSSGEGSRDDAGRGSA